MRPNGWRQVAIVGLALILLISLARTAWTARQTARVQAELNDAARWLQGTTVVLDAGHGGRDPGATVGETREKDLTLQITLILRDLLQEHGAKVVLTRDQDQYHGGTVRQELTRRVDVVRAANPDLFVSIHANKDRCNCWGAQTFYQRHGLPAGKELALAIQSRLRQMTPTTRTALAADYFVLRTSPVPSVIVEVGFLTNEKEHLRLKEPAYQRTVAAAIALGMADHLRAQVPPARAEGELGE